MTAAHDAFAPATPHIPAQRGGTEPRRPAPEAVPPSRLGAVLAMAFIVFGMAVLALVATLAATGAMVG